MAGKVHRDTASTNAQQREYWTTEDVHWAEEAERYDAMNREFGAAMLEAAGLQVGECVLDVGCGNGATTIAAARAVEPTGRVVGIDVSRRMLELARRRTDDARLDNVELVVADAQVQGFDPGSFDVVISRFGVMFFDDPGAAFTNLHSALRPGGRLAVVVWQDVFHSEWIIVPGGAAAEHVGFPDLGPPGAPGPFALADTDRLRHILRAARFDDIQVKPVTRPMRIGDDVDDVLQFIVAQPLVRDDLFAGKPASAVATAKDAARAALEPYARRDGVVMNGGAWLATARKGLV